MSKTIRVNSINDAALKRLEERGIKVMVVGPAPSDELKALEHRATKALKQGDTGKVRSTRLKMLRLINGDKT